MNLSWDTVRRAPARSGLAMAALIETVTCIGRFGLGLRARDHLELTTAFTFGCRVHHGIIGLALLAAWLLMRAAPRFRAWRWRPVLLAAGIALVVSDVVHHFAVLLPTTGCADFP